MILATTVTAPELFGPRHLAILAAAVLISAAALWGAQKIRGTDAERPITRTAGWFLLAGSLAWMGWWLLPQNWQIGHSLPLHYSDVLRIITVVALVWRPRWAVTVVYLWGLTLNTQALLTPHPSQLHEPYIEFFFYWSLHIAVLAVAIALIWGLGYWPRWRDFGVAFGAAFIWAAIVMVVNGYLDTNYGFLNEPPEGGSIVDWLGPWPIYVLWIVLLVGGVWALMTWPFARKHRKQS